MMPQGHTYEIKDGKEAVALDMSIEQLKQSLILKGYAIAQVTAPVFLKWLQTIQLNLYIEHAIMQLPARGCTLENVVELQGIQIASIGQGCSFAQVKDPIFLNLYKEYTAVFSPFQCVIGQIMRAGHSLAEIEGLNTNQLLSLCSGAYTIAQVKIPGFSELRTIFGQQFSAVIEELLSKGIKRGDIARLTPLQLQSLELKNTGMTLEKLRHPNFLLRQFQRALFASPSLAVIKEEEEELCSDEENQLNDAHRNIPS